MYVSTANGGLPDNATEILSYNVNGRPDNVVMINTEKEGSYQWRVDCIEEGSRTIRAGDVWKFKIYRDG